MKTGLQSCETCGRDTTARICGQCTGRANSRANESKGRKSLSSQQAAHLGNLDDDDETFEPDPYHGDTLRDDI